MKLVILVALIFTLAACSSGKKEKIKSGPSPEQVAAQLKLQEMRKNHLNAQLACHQLKNTYIKPATTEQKLKSNEIEFRFVRDEKKALSFIRNFNVNNLALEENKNEYNFVLNNCIPYNKETFTGNCDTAFSVYTYFKGLTYGARNYKWSKKTKSEALNLVKSYANKVSTVESSLIEISIALAVMKDLADKNMLNKKNKLAVNKLHDDLLKSIEALRLQYEESKSRYATEENIPCNEKVAIYTKENELTKLHGKEFIALLTNVNF